MNIFRLLTTSFFLLLAVATLSAQTANLQFKLDLMPDQQTWVVSVLPDNTISSSLKTQTGSGQVTLVAPVNFNYDNFKNFGGTWEENARVNEPVEAKDKAYVSFGFVVEEPKITLLPNKETVLFTFTAPAEFMGQIQLFDNYNDPFLPPNSYQTNPGNDLGIIDFGAIGGIAYYNYGSNYEANEPRAVLTGNEQKSGEKKSDPLAAGAKAVLISLD